MLLSLLPLGGLKENEDLRARAQEAAGLPRVLQQSRTVRPHPSRGGSPGYDVAFRLSEIGRYQRGEATTASRTSIHRWMDNLIPRRPSGNKASDNLVGMDMFLLTLYVTVWPDATADELRIYIYEETGDGSCVR